MAFASFRWSGSGAGEEGEPICNALVMEKRLPSPCREAVKVRSGRLTCPSGVVASRVAPERMKVSMAISRGSSGRLNSLVGEEGGAVVGAREAEGA